MRFAIPDGNVVVIQEVSEGLEEAGKSPNPVFWFAL